MIKIDNYQKKRKNSPRAVDDRERCYRLNRCQIELAVHASSNRSINYRRPIKGISEARRRASKIVARAEGKGESNLTENVVRSSARGSRS